MTDDFGNPLFKEDKFRGGYGSDTMTRGGTATKTLLFLVAMVAGAAVSWNMFMKATEGFDLSTLQTVEVGTNEEDEPIKEVRSVDTETGAQSAVPDFDMGTVNMIAIGGCLAAFVIAMIIIFNPQTASTLGFAYAILEGLALGAVSARFELAFPGIVMQALAATVGVAFVMWVLFASGIIKVTSGFVSFVLSMMFGILILYFVDIGLGLFGAERLDIIHGNSWTSIGVSIFIVFIASLNFAIDYHQIEEGVKNGAPKHMEWYCAFGLLLTIVWCYLEILRLLAKLRSQDLRSRTWAAFIASLAFPTKKAPALATADA